MKKVILFLLAIFIANTAAVFGIKGLLLTQKGHAGVSNLNLGELKKVLKKLEDRK